MRKVALIGAGGMGVRHATNYADMAGVQVVAIVDIRRDAGEALAKTLGARSFTDFDAMLEVQPDIIDICLPTPLHHEFALRAAAAGKHIIVEKPMARTMDQCREMIHAAEKAGVALTVGHVVRYFPEYAAGKAELDAGAIGRPGSATTIRAGLCPGRWFADFAQSGGVILDLMVHDFDWLRWVFGNAQQVSAKGPEGCAVEYITSAEVEIRFHSGVIARTEGNWANAARFKAAYEVVGDGGVIRFDNQAAPPLSITKKGHGAAAIECQCDVSGCRQMLQHFLDCLDRGMPPSITGEDGMRAVEIALAAHESIRTGRPVEVGK